MQRRVCVYVCYGCYARTYVCYVSMYVMYVCVCTCMYVCMYVMLCYVPCSGSSSWLALLFLYKNLHVFRHVPRSLVLPASRKFAEGSRKGEAEDFFWNNEYGVNFMYICMLCYVMLFYAELCYVMFCYVMLLCV